MAFKPTGTSRIAILGRTGSGKTTLSRTIQACYPRVLIVDKVQDYQPDGVTYFFKDFSEFSRFMLNHQSAPRLRVVFQFDLHERDFLPLAEEIFALAYDWGDCLVNVDECQFYSNSHYLSNLNLVGRRRNIALLCSTQRPANMHKDLVSQASDLFVGTLYETNDMLYLKGMLPDEERAKVPNLQPTQFLHYAPGQPAEIVANR